MIVNELLDTILDKTTASDNGLPVLKKNLDGSLSETNDAMVQMVCKKTGNRVMKCSVPGCPNAYEAMVIS